MQSAEFVTCTFENTQGTATAAPVSLGGRVTDSLGNPIAGAGMSLTDTATGATRNTRTNLDGYYTFSDVSTTAFYSLTITAKRYRFADGGTQYFTLTEDNFSMNFRSSN